MQYLGFNETELKERGGIYTGIEISQQPVVWKKIWKTVVENKSEITHFLKNNKFNRVILTGAGTSAFIGNSLVGLYRKNICDYAEVISTTDMVSHPDHYLNKETPTLLISFGRSGNSPESVGAMELADKHIDICHHLIITCNAEGKAARYKAKNGKFVFELPEETNDRSLAMTSSYSGMLLSAVLIALINDIEEYEDQIDEIVTIGQKVITELAPKLKELAVLDFKRAVFLGSGPFYGTAKEAHLKLQELTDGKVICSYDSFLGFRHGPKSVVDDTSLVFYIFSNNDQVLRYEKDLVRSMEKGQQALQQVGQMYKSLKEVDIDFVLPLTVNGTDVLEELLCVCGILPAQILAFYKSMQLGLAPDSPSVSGAISRVVEGVVIYN